MWRLFRASATGQRNLDQGAPGQDASHCSVTDELLVAVVCDGAGSVPQGQAGAEFLAGALVDAVASAVRADRDMLDVQADAGARLEAAIEHAVAAARSRLAELADARALALDDFSCTLVGCVASADGGRFFHIGDGFAIYQGAAGDSVLSRPENGEYADETFFATDEDWQDHLRFTPVPRPERGSVIGLMSDGTAPFAVNRERSAFFRPFIDPIAAFLRDAAPSHGDAALRNLLESPRASEISHDDKTLVLAFVR